jgi:hypothetical protein
MSNRKFPLKEVTISLSVALLFWLLETIPLTRRNITLESDPVFFWIIVGGLIGFALYKIVEYWDL